ncbi:MAG TPA: Crp/Fnr family transcriptional regulator [Chitinophagaceae bacterium]|nr:Crp/Fnr family transcriptional regulator [Chitinophagaceae bacterium]
MQYFYWMNELDVLRDFIVKAYPLPAEALDALCTAWQPISCKRKTVLTAAGETEKYLYFVLEGVQRAFFLDDKKEATIVFTYPPSFAGVADSFLTQTPSLFFFETLTQSRMLRTSYRQMEELMEQYPEIQKMILHLTGFILKGVLLRQMELQCFSAEEKFRSLLRRSPHVLQLISHKYLASYLGVDASTFSKLLGTVKL